jgi:hypothetical protein
MRHFRFTRLVMPILEKRFWRPEAIAPDATPVSMLPLADRMIEWERNIVVHENERPVSVN